MRNDHSILITLAILLGTVLTVSIAIVGSIYNHSKDIQRDEFYARHCGTVVKATDTNVNPATIKYRCGG